jgi:hypothetical protein
MILDQVFFSTSQVLPLNTLRCTCQPSIDKNTSHPHSPYLILTVHCVNPSLNTSLSPLFQRGKKIFLYHNIFNVYCKIWLVHHWKVRKSMFRNRWVNPVWNQIKDRRWPWALSTCAAILFSIWKRIENLEFL